jgi:ABC-2 type transport system ATP-binding protein
VVIAVEDFHKTYGETVAVQGITFSVAGGEILGLAGPNGAGKTTTLRALAGILKPTRGRLSIDGFDLASQPLHAKQRLAYVPDDPRLFDRLTVWEHFRFTAGIYRLDDWEEDAEGLLQRLELVEKRDSLTSDLSRGMRQKVAIGCGYLHRPSAILLDEPLTGLDPRGIRTMKDLIQEHAAAGAALIVSSHLLSLLEDLATTVLIVRRGQVVLNSPLAELRVRLAAGERHETLEELFFRLTEGPAAAAAAEPEEVATVEPLEPGAVDGVDGVDRVERREDGVK